MWGVTRPGLSVQAFDLVKMSGSISGPGVDRRSWAEGEEGGRREGGKPLGEISQTGKPLDSYWISCGSFSLGVVKVMLPAISLVSREGWWAEEGRGATLQTLTQGAEKMQLHSICTAPQIEWDSFDCLLVSVFGSPIKIGSQDFSFF